MSMKPTTVAEYLNSFPAQLIEKLATYQAKEYRENGVKWK